MCLALLKMLALFNASLPSVALPTVTLPKRDLVLCFVCMLVGTVPLLHQVGSSVGGTVRLPPSVPPCTHCP